MATNPYFRSNYKSSNKDQKLINDLTVESIKNAGIDVWYLPRTLVNEDELYGEDQSSAFKKSYEIECMMNPIDAWGGDREFLGKFGIEIQDEITIFISITRFEQEITSIDSDITRPREGDLIQFPPEIDRRERVFEISYVPPESIFYQYGELYTYEIRMRAFEFGGETFDGSESGWQSFDDNFSTETQVSVDGSDDFQLGEIVTSADESLHAYVGSWDSDDRVLGLFHVRDLSAVQPDVTITGESGATAVIEDVITEFGNDVSDNEFLEQESPVQNFSRSNPFGDE